MVIVKNTDPELKTPEDYVNDYAMRCWSEKESINFYFWQFFQNQPSIGEDKGKLRAAVKAFKLAVEFSDGKLKEDELRAECAAKEIERLAVKAMINRIRYEEKCYTTIMSTAPNLEESMRRSASIQINRASTFMNLDTSSFKDQLGDTETPF